MRGCSLSAEAIRTVLPSPECSTILTGGLDRQLRLWDLQSPERSRVLGDRPGALPDGEARSFHAHTVRARDSAPAVLHIAERRGPAASPRAPGAPRSAAEDGAPAGARGSLAGAPDLHGDAITQLAPPPPLEPFPSPSWPRPRPWSHSRP